MLVGPESQSNTVSATVSSIDGLFANNRAWAARHVAESGIFHPLWPGSRLRATCGSAARTAGYPRTRLSDFQPGEVFVHRNVANLVVHSDLNCLSVLQYAIETLKVEHVMVVGHYGCGGVQAVAEKRSTGLADNWLRHIEDIAHKHAARLDTAADDEARGARLAELNVIEQVANVCRTTILRRSVSGSARRGASASSMACATVAAATRHKRQRRSVMARALRGLAAEFWTMTSPIIGQRESALQVSPQPVAADTEILRFDLGLPCPRSGRPAPGRSRRPWSSPACRGRC